MPITSHKKSRRGCNVCKTRKVKCGEELPQCANCVKRGERCSYTPALRFREVGPKLRRTVAQTHLSSSYFSPETLLDFFPAENCIRPGAAGENRILELRFMHFYAVSTSHTWSPSQELWVAAAPRASSAHGFLLDAVLAVAALHWSVSYEKDRTWAELASTTYFDRAVSTYTEALEHRAQHGYALPLVLTSALISFYSLVQMGNLSSDEDEVDSDPLFQWIRLARGSNLVFKAGNNLEALNRTKLLKQLYARFPELHNDALAFARGNGEEFEFLRDWSTESEELSEDDKRVYEDTICYVGLIHHTVARNEQLLILTRRIVSMVPRCKVRFTEFLEERRPRALAILAHAFAALKPIEGDMWWLRGVHEYVISAIRSVVPAEWQRLMPRP